jgi:hypothetical protein
MRLSWSVLLCLLEDGAHVGLHFLCNPFCHDRLNLLMISLNTRRKPERDAQSIASALRCSGLK